MLRHFDTAVWDTAVCYKIVVLDAVQEGWSRARAIGLIFHTHVGDNCGVRIVSVSSSLEMALSNAVQLKDEAHLVQSCLERSWLGRTEGVCVSLSLGLCSHEYCLTGRGKRHLPSLAWLSHCLGLLILSLCLYLNSDSLKSGCLFFP